MPALKDIGNIAGRTGTLTLTQSPLWNMDVAKIDVVQLHAFIRRLSDAGQRDEAESAVEIAMQEVQLAVARNEIPPPPMLAYFRPYRITMTAGELRNGLVFLGAEKSAPIMFALETGMNLDEVARLTHKTLATFAQHNALSPIARECLASAPRHIRSQYVFWRQSNEGKTYPMFGLDADVFDAFGMIWGELVVGYANLIMIDDEADRRSMDCYIDR
ncbi:MAG: hypothetical protein WKG03_13850 [Telluria sp.]